MVYNGEHKYSIKKIFLQQSYLDTWDEGIDAIRR